MGAFKTKGFINHVYVTTIFWKFLVLLGFSLGEGVKYHAVTGKIINSEHAHRKITFSLNVKPCSYFVRMRLWYEFEYHNSVTNNCRQLTCDQPLRNFRCENTKRQSSYLIRMKMNRAPRRTRHANTKGEISSISFKRCYILKKKIIQRAIKQSKIQATQQADLVHLEKIIWHFIFVTSFWEL